MTRRTAKTLRWRSNMQLSERLTGGWSRIARTTGVHDGRVCPSQAIATCCKSYAVCYSASNMHGVSCPLACLSSKGVSSCTGIVTDFLSSGLASPSTVLDHAGAPGAGAIIPHHTKTAGAPGAGAIIPHHTKTISERERAVRAVQTEPPTARSTCFGSTRRRTVHGLLLCTTRWRCHKTTAQCGLFGT